MARIKNRFLRIIVARRIRNLLKRRKRALNIRPLFFNRFESGESTLIRELRNDAQYHYRYFRMDKKNFDDLLQKVFQPLQKQRKHSRPISPMEKLAITLRYLASGNSQISIALSYKISPSSISGILRETMKVLCQSLEREFLPTPTQETWKTVEAEFHTKWNFPNCCGAIDGKHIRIRAPHLSGSMNYNYKGFFSMVLLAIVDANYRFIAVDIGASGSLSDGGVLSRSAIGKALFENKLQLPEPKRIGHEFLPHVIVGDDAFPLRNNLLKPYSGKELTVEKRIFNYRLSRARMVVENAFGILASRWRIFHTSIYAETDLTKLIVKTCVLLHNYLMTKKDYAGITGDSVTNENVDNGTWRQVDNSRIDCIANQGSNNYAMSAANIRDKFKDFVNGEGSVVWQGNMI